MYPPTESPSQFTPQDMRLFGGLLETIIFQHAARIGSKPRRGVRQRCLLSTHAPGSREHYRLPTQCCPNMYLCAHRPCMGVGHAVHELQLAPTLMGCVDVVMRAPFLD